MGNQSKLQKEECDETEHFADHSFTSFPDVDISFHEANGQILDDVDCVVEDFEHQQKVLNEAKKLERETARLQLEREKIKLETAKIGMEKTKIEMETAKIWVEIEEERANSRAIIAKIQKTSAANQFKKTMGHPLSDDFLDITDEVFSDLCE